METLTALGTLASQRIVIAIGSSIESNTLEKFAKVFFAEEATPFYQPEPIRHPLLSAISHDALLSQKAVKFFYVLNYYIDHADELTDTLVLRIINYVIEKVGPFPVMHDELVAQLCKQTFKNPDPAKTTRAWRILSILIGIIPPSVRLLPAFLNYVVANGPADLLARIQYRLWRCATTGARTKRLTSIEFEALKRRVPVILQAEFADERSVNFEVDTATTTKDALKLLLEARDIRTLTGYSLVAVIHDREIVFSDADKVLDVVAEAEALGGAAILPEDPTKKPATKEFTEGEIRLPSGAGMSEVAPYSIPETEQQLYRSMFEYKPSKAGEIPLARNEVIILYERLDSEWWKGKSKSTGRYGCFPANYVTEMTTEEMFPAPSSGSQKHTVVGKVDDQIFKRKSLAVKDLQAVVDTGNNYTVTVLEDKRLRITVTLDRNGKELAIGLRASRKRGAVIQKLEQGGIASLAGLRVDDQLVTVDDRSVEGLKVEKISKMMKEAGNRVKIVVIRKPESVAAPPPVPKFAAPAPRQQSVWNKTTDSAYPWKIMVRKAFVDPLTKTDDITDLDLVTTQIISSDRAKADRSKLKQLKAGGNFSDILDIALEWPLFFAKTFTCVVSLTFATFFFLLRK